MFESSDEPMALRDPEEVRKRLRLLSQPHIAPLADYVRQVRDVRRDLDPALIPDFDPLDGGVAARVLYVLEAPGPIAVRTGFVSRNNPDQTARNFCLMNRDADIPRRLTATWNIVPWYLGNGNKIHPARPADIAEGRAHLVRLLSLLPHLQFVVFVGRKAQRARASIAEEWPGVQHFAMPHPSPQFVNRAPGNRESIRSAFMDLSAKLQENGA